MLRCSNVDSRLIQKFIDHLLARSKEDTKNSTTYKFEELSGAVDECSTNPFKGSAWLSRSGTQVTMVSKSIFANLKVVRQVDCKFIIVTDGLVIYCLDQHAVDERIKLEEMERHIFGIDGTKRNISSRKLPSRIPVQLSYDDLQVLTVYESSIKSWGFQFEIPAEKCMPAVWDAPKCGTLHEKLTSVQITALPVIGDRTVEISDLLVHLTYLRNTHAPNTIPRGIVRLLHSRACRSAIMFGDPLTLEECQRLIKDLSKCKLPFQCAHGRPSIVPLAVLRHR